MHVSYSSGTEIEYAATRCGAVCASDATTSSALVLHPPYLLRYLPALPALTFWYGTIPDASATSTDNPGTTPCVSATPCQALTYGLCTPLSGTDTSSSSSSSSTGMNETFYAFATGTDTQHQQQEKREKRNST
eukprot:3940342-Rhodomonas_salina.2